MSEQAAAAEKLDMTKFRGPLMGTPEKARVSNICLEGYHENFAPRGFCKGGGWWMNKKWMCGCACHRYARNLPPDADFDPPKDPPRDPLKPTLSEELRAWAEQNDAKRTIASAPRRPKVEADQISDSGRRARGALELQVLDLCMRYTQDEIEWDEDEDPFLTPSIISDEIAHLYGCTAPSTGAIGAVFDRWESWGLAYFATKPVRFLMFAPVVDELGFEAARERMKNRAKQRQ